MVRDVFVVALVYHSLQTLPQLFGNNIVAQFRRVLRLIFYCCINHLDMLAGVSGDVGRDKSLSGQNHRLRGHEWVIGLDINKRQQVFINL